MIKQTIEGNERERKSHAMYDYIKGTLVKITAKYIVIEANGLGLYCHCSESI